MRASLTDLDRATERLMGIMMGISIDNRINEREIVGLSEWLNLHRHFYRIEPFKQVVQTLRKVLADKIIEEEEKEEILELCWLFDKNEYIVHFARCAIRRLHGVLSGIALDERIRDDEVIGLKNWMEVHQHLKGHWPFSEVWEMVQKMLEDGKLEDEEKAELLEYCKNFEERRIENPTVHDDIYDEAYMQNFAHILEPFTAICDRQHKIEFRGKSFCFTGPSAHSSRKELHTIVVALNGTPKNGISKSLDYLVIGSQSSPCWYYSTYGRKIENIMNNRAKGKNTIIVHEDDFAQQARTLLQKTQT